MITAQMTRLGMISILYVLKFIWNDIAHVILKHTYLNVVKGELGMI
jgi:hypothetical protein